MGGGKLEEGRRGGKFCAWSRMQLVNPAFETWCFGVFNFWSSPPVLGFHFRSTMDLPHLVFIFSLYWKVIAIISNRKPPISQHRDLTKTCLVVRPMNHSETMLTSPSVDHGEHWTELQSSASCNKIHEFVTLIFGAPINSNLSHHIGISLSLLAAFSASDCSSAILAKSARRCKILCETALLSGVGRGKASSNILRLGKASLRFKTLFDFDGLSFRRRREDFDVGTLRSDEVGAALRSLATLLL